MPGKVRVFLSSTMEDLANERQAVVEQIADLGLEPVNAEGLLPNGATSWDLLADEIASSHIFVLLMGDRYGWVPTSGAGAGSGKSVTHLEVDLARISGLPVLPFVKRLKYGTDSTSEDAVRRDTFRKQIGEWKDGHFRAEFDLALDLARKVRKALLDVFQDTYLKRAVRQVNSAGSKLTYEPATVPPEPAGATRLAEALLLAGAGFSISAGYPTASSLADVLGKRLGLSMNGPEMLARHSFAEIASFAERRLGRSELLEVVRELLDTPIPVNPTPAHFRAAQSFSTILTTNYDLLFERACAALGRKYAVATPHRPLPDVAPVMIYKIDGSIDDPDTLVLTHEDAARAATAEPFWNAVNKLLQTHGVIVIGHSVRDITSQRLLSTRNLKLPGLYVSPHLDELDSVRLETYGIDPVIATANDFLAR
ncbi:DUF4062 domain-containing protein [Sphingomonas sp. GV3]|jgi:hypothetical protein|uniref:DUF4062 domain-containing protein n=1 Tax=Sphingomonas sp. GV3 TaxID=3040671 RepID=UPI00280AB74E|nr:DUF4062 domain-containing protein [Sphingomonas sp. GV3]